MKNILLKDNIRTLSGSGNYKTSYGEIPEKEYEKEYEKKPKIDAYEQYITKIVEHAHLESQIDAVNENIKKMLEVMQNEHKELNDQMAATQQSIIDEIRFSKNNVIMAIRSFPADAITFLSLLIIFVCSLSIVITIITGYALISPLASIFGVFSGIIYAIMAIIYKRKNG